MHADAGDGVGVGQVVLDELVRAHVPYLDGAVCAAGCYAGVIIVELHTIHDTVYVCICICVYI
jgi:hypothetical protein